jgi:hypothetical protein
MFSKLAKESPPFAADDSRGAALAGAPRPKGSKRTVAVAKEIASSGTQVEFDTLLRQRDLLNAELTLRQQDWLLAGAALAAPSSLRQAAIETLTDATTQSVLRDSVYAAFHLAVAVTAHKMEARLLQDYPHIEPLSRNVSKAWAGDWLRPAAVAPAPKRQPLEAAGKAPISGPEDTAPKGEAAPVNPATKK